jgi:hypothetical protein
MTVVLRPNLRILNALEELPPVGGSMFVPSHHRVVEPASR